MAEFYPNLRILIKPLFQRLKKNHLPWSDEHTQVVKQVKSQVKELPCLGILHPEAFPIIETDASNIGYGGILKQDFQNKISIVRFHSGVWSGPQLNYSTVKKEILAIVLCIQKFQNDVFNKKFLLRVDCKSAKEILQKDVQNLVSKQNFVRLQAILSIFDFEIELSKELQMFYLIFSHGNFYRENEQAKTRPYQTYYQSFICNAKIPNFKSFRGFGKTPSTIFFKPSKICLPYKRV